MRCSLTLLGLSIVACAPHRARSKSVELEPKCPALATVLLPQSAGISVSGTLIGDELELHSVDWMGIPPVAGAAVGTTGVDIRVESASGDVLHRVGARLGWACAFGPSGFTFRMFDEVLPADPRARRIVLSRRGRDIITRDASPSQPTIDNVEAHVDPERRVVLTRWDAFDADGGELEAAIEISFDGGESFTMVGSTFERQLEYPIDSIPASCAALARVTVQDGFHGAVAVSPPFVVPPKPPRVRIDAPGPGHVARDGVVRLDAEAYDIDIGERLLGNAIVWSSDRDGVVLEGGSGDASLSDGHHVLSAHATNGAGLTGVARVNVKVVRPPATAPNLIARFLGPSRLLAGLRAEYLVWVQNSGNAQSGPLTLQYEPPPGVEIVSIGGAGWTCSSSPETFCTGSPLQPLETVELALVVRATGRHRSIESVRHGVRLIEPHDRVAWDNHTERLVDVTNLDVRVRESPGEHVVRVANIGHVSESSPIEIVHRVRLFSHPGTVRARHPWQCETLGQEVRCEWQGRNLAPGRSLPPIRIAIEPEARPR